MKEYEFWRDRESGRLYAVVLEDGLVSGSCGPLTASEARERFLSTFDYSPDEAAWFEQHREGFDLHRLVGTDPAELAQPLGAPLDRLRVRDAMHPGVITCMPSTSLRDVARMMARSHIHAVVVWGDEEDDAEGLWSVVSDGDLVAAAADDDLRSRLAIEAARTPAATVREDEALRTAAELMRERAVTHLVVMSESGRRPVGVLSTLDLARVLGGSA
jgi:CBS domain-containing protein